MSRKWKKPLGPGQIDEKYKPRCKPDATVWIRERPEENLKEIATGIFKNAIFTDRHVRSGDQNLLQSIFMILVFMEKRDLEVISTDCGMIYADYSSSCKMAINGYPIFFSASFLNKVDADKVWFYVAQLENAEKAALSGL